MTFAKRIAAVPVSELAKVAKCSLRVAYYWKEGKRTPKPFVQDAILALIEQAKAAGFRTQDK